MRLGPPPWCAILGCELGQVNEIRLSPTCAPNANLQVKNSGEVSHSRMIGRSKAQLFCVGKPVKPSAPKSTQAVPSSNG